MRPVRSAVLLASTLAFLAAGAVRADDWGDDKSELSADFAKSKAICRAVRNAEVPKTGQVSPAQIKALKGCGSEALYYGEDGKPDYVRARQCALAETDNGEADTDEPFGGFTILMQVYANGLGGAPRNLDLATHFACQLDGAPAESDGRVTHLAELKAKGPGKTPFDYCDDITSGMSQGLCADRDQTLTNKARQAGLDALALRVAPGAKVAYGRLRKAAYAFAGLHGDNEVDLSGTGRAAFSIEAEEEQRDAFVKQLRLVLDGKVAPATPVQAKAADAKLNASWNKLRAHGQKVQEYGTVTLKDVVEAQRAWIAYRDAFLAFAKAQTPAAPTDGLFAALTQARTKTLAELPG